MAKLTAPDRISRWWASPVHRALLVFFLASLGLRLVILFESPYASGADGYYYAAQLHYLFTKGHFFSPDSSAVLYLMAGAAQLAGDIVIGIKILVALLGALIVFPAYSLAADRDRPARGLVFAALVAGGALFAQFSFDYVKNLAGILVFLVFLLQVRRTLEQGWSIRRAAALAALCLAAFLTHKLMAGLSFLVLGGLVAWQFRRHWKPALAGLVALVVAALLLGRFVPGALAFTDFSRLAGLFATSPQFAPASFLALYPAFVPRTLELLAFSLAPLALLVPRCRAVFRDAALLAPMLLLWALAIFPFLVFAPDNLAFRLFLLLFLPGAWFLTRLAPAPRRTAGMLSVLVLGLAWQTTSLVEGRRLSPQDYALYETLLPLIRLPEDHLLIVHHGFDYFYCFHGKGDAFHFLPEERHQTRPLYRLAHGVSRIMLEEHGLADAETRYLPGGYTLMREIQWEKLLAALPEAARRRLLTWKNPHIARPGYMREADRFLKGP